MQGLVCVLCFSVFAAVSLASITRNPDDGPGTPDPMCPFPSDELVYFPYPSDCSKYWECFQGHKYLMQCPNNLLWNQDKNYCDFPENVDCEITSTSGPTTTESTTEESKTPSHSTTTPDTTTTTTSTTTTTTPEPTETTEISTESSQETTTTSGLCPNNEDEISYHPYPLDCAKFVECNEGRPRIFTCPGDFFWNDKIKSCDNPENVNCVISTTTESTTPTTTVSTTSSTSQPTTKTTTESSTETSEVTTEPTKTPKPTTPAVLCPDDEPISFHPYPGDCTKFVECTYGKARIDTCPGKLYWNDFAKTCDFPYNVDCEM